MPCYTPLYSQKLSDGSWSLTSRVHLRDSWQRVACGQCIGCLLRRSRDWAVRCTHHSLSCAQYTNHFVTLTYSPDRLPRHGVTGRETFEVHAIRDYMKRLRKNTGIVGVKFFGCREYGERTLRPHYHLCLFGLPLDDYKFYKRSADGFSLFNSHTLSEAWQGRGHVVVAPSTFNTVGYTARYTTKKLGSALKPVSRHYATDILTGEVFEHLPEKCYASNRPGIGRAFFEKHHDNLLALGSTVIGNRRYPLPRYYLRLAKERGSDLYDEYCQERSKYYQNAERFDDAQLLRKLRDQEIIIDRMVRSVV